MTPSHDNRAPLERPDARRSPHDDAPEGPRLSRLTRTGLWYLYSATPRLWAGVARGFALEVGPAAPDDVSLERAEADAVRALRFVPVPLAVTAAVLALTAWLRPGFSALLSEISDRAFLSLLMFEPLGALGHFASEQAAVVLSGLVVWLLSLASVLVSFAPIWLAFRHQMQSAASVVSLALALPPDGHESLSPAYPRVRYALSMLRDGRQRWGRRRS
jgi:hypothetical protein